MLTVSCCYKCSEREVGCHGKCERYKKEKEKCDLVRENLIKENNERYVRVEHFVKLKRRKGK